MAPTSRMSSQITIIWKTAASPRGEAKRQNRAATCVRWWAGRSGLVAWSSARASLATTTNAATQPRARGAAHASAMSWTCATPTMAIAPTKMGRRSGTPIDWIAT